jgi:hypothetical protein
MTASMEPTPSGEPVPSTIGLSDRQPSIETPEWSAPNGSFCSVCGTATTGAFCVECGAAVTGSSGRRPGLPSAAVNPWSPAAAIAFHTTASAPVLATTEFQAVNPATGDYVLVKARRRRREKVGVLVVGVVLAAGAAVGWVDASHQSTVAAQWRQKDLAEVAVAHTLSGNLTAANRSISGLNGQVASMSTQITGLQGQLATVATQKEKAVDQNTALTALLSSAGTVSSDLQTCVQDTNSFESELIGDIDSGNVLGDPYLSGNATNVDSVCTTAETANRQMQADISAETGG